MMLAPVAFLPLLALPVFLIGGPMLAVNVLSSFPYTREIRYHYSSLVLVGVILGTVEAIAWIGRRRPGAIRFLVGMVVATSLAATVAWGPSPISTKYHWGIWPLQADRQSAKSAAVDMIPDGAPTSAIYNLTPHLAHRDLIYDFPVPWRNVNWGVRGEHLDDPAHVQWIIVDRRELSTDDQALLAAPGPPVPGRSTRDEIVRRAACHPPKLEQAQELAAGLDQPEVAVVSPVENRGVAGLGVGEQEEVVPEQVHLQRGFLGIHRLRAEPLRLDDAGVGVGVVVVRH